MCMISRVMILVTESDPGWLQTTQFKNATISLAMDAVFLSTALGGCCPIMEAVAMEDLLSHIFRLY